MSRDWIDVRIATYNIHRSRGLDRRTRPERIAAVLARHRRRHRRAAGSDRARPGRARAMPKRSARRSAWAGSWRRRASCGATSSATWSSAAIPIRDHAQLDLSWKTCEPRNSQRVAIDLGDGRLLQRLQRAPRHGAARAPLPGAAPRRVDSRPAHAAARRSCSATSTNGAAASSPTSWPSGSRASTSIRTCAGAARIPGFFPLLHLDHIYFDGDIEIRAHRTAPHAPGAGRLGPPAARRRHPRR